MFGKCDSRNSKEDIKCSCIAILSAVGEWYKQAITILENPRGKRLYRPTGYYTAVRRYEFYLRVVKTIFHE